MDINIKKKKQTFPMQVLGSFYNLSGKGELAQ